MSEIEKIVIKILFCQLQQTGLLRDRSKLIPLYNRWFDETLTILNRAQSLYPDPNAAWREWNDHKEIWLKDSDLKPMLELLEITMKALPDILTGQIKSTDVIFPNSSMSLVGGVYKNNKIADYYNALLADALILYLKERLKKDPEVKIKIFEIGAGTGGTSAIVFKKLKPYEQHIAEYCYTDISRAFLQHADQEYASAYSYIKLKIFNIEVPIDSQGIEAGTYDIVIAANVLHATKNICQALRNTKALLKTRGLLFLNEISNNNLFSHLTFGLLEGWWLYEDAQLRIPGCPALSLEMWQKTLKNEGFEKVIPLGTQKGDQQIIIAESNGVVRQKRNPSQATSLPQQTPADDQKAIGGDLLGKSVQFVKEVLAKTIKLAPEKLDLHTPFEKYGIDSILQVNMIKELEKTLGEIPKTVLFEYPTLQELARYLVDTHSDQLQKKFSLYEAVEKPSSVKLSPPPIPSSNASHKSHAEDIAIIGMSGRYPMAENLEQLWANLKAGRNCLAEAPLSKRKATKAKTLHRKYYGGFLDQVDRFDYQLFEMAKQQVFELSPEVRLFLEIAWETFEDGGYCKNSLIQLQQRDQLGVGVFVGNMYNQYFWNLPSLEQALLSSNGTDWNIANRISHFFNLTGPSLALNTACSSSLYAIHLACECLKQKNCSMAIAGGINLTLNLSKYALLERAKFLGSGDQSKSFGMGDGMIPGEGVGAVLLKPLAQAIEDRDRIHAVIKGGFINHSGGRQMYTAPDPRQQAQLVLNSLKKSGVDPASIGYIESAANGSALGDSIEVAALQKALSQVMSKDSPCALGSIKSNLGHLEAASGVSQLHKVVYQLKNATLVPTINSRPINPNIKLANTPFYLQETLQLWKQTKFPRRSLINSFGAGGAYANIIVEEYPPAPPEATGCLPDQLLFIFSAKTLFSLFQYLNKIKSFLESHHDIDIYNVAFSLQKINHNLENRLAIIASSKAILMEKLTHFQNSKKSSLSLMIYTSLDQQKNPQPESEVSRLKMQKEWSQLAQSWAAGTSIDFGDLYTDIGSWCDLPHYAFDHQEDFALDSFPKEYQKEKGKIYAYDHPLLKGHQFNGKQMLIGAVYASMAIDSYFQIFPHYSQAYLKKIGYFKPAVVNHGEKVELDLIPMQKEKGVDFQILFRILGCPTWQLAASGQFDQADFPEKQIDLAYWRHNLQEFKDLNLIYAYQSGVQWGDIYKKITSLYIGEKQLLAFVDLSESVPNNDWNYLDPILTNSCYLAILYFILKNNLDPQFIPFGINEIHFKKSKGCPNCWLLINLNKKMEDLLVFDIDVLTETSNVVLTYKGYTLKRSQLEISLEDDLLLSSPSAENGDLLKAIEEYLCAKFGKNEALSNILEIKFLELGLDSSDLVKKTKEIEGELNIELEFTLFFEYSNIKELARFFFQEYQGVFSQFLLNRSAI